jgi:hypothetical protein
MLEDLLRLAAGAASMVLALLFLRAALHKASDRAAFEGVLASYGLGPLGLVGLGARIVPALELICATLLVVPVTSRVGAALAIVLLTVYGAAMALNLAQGRRLLDCGCGGAPLALSWSLVARNAALAAAAIPASLGLGRPQDWSEAVSIAGVGAAVFLTIVVVERLAANHARMRRHRRGRLWAFSGPAASSLWGSAAE